jgi:hypothetical protein
MTIPPGGDDRTIRSPSSAGLGGPGDRTVPVRPGAPGGGGDPTIPADRGGTGGGPPTGGSDAAGEEAPDRRLGLLLGGIALAGVLLGALVALLVGGGSGSSATASSTTSSSSTTTSSTTSTSTTSTTAPAGPPQVIQFQANQSNPPCTASTNIQVTWSTQNAPTVTLAVDGGTVGVFGPTGSHLVAFSCPPASHSYKLTANGANGQKDSKTIVVTTVIPPTTTSSTTTTT